MATVKTCFKCLRVKPLVEFYRHAAMADGHLNKCMECARAYALARRALHIERVRAYDRERSRQFRRRQHNKNTTKAWRVEHPDRWAAQKALYRAVRDGRVLRWPVCAVPDCSGRPVAHHPDYARPLDVVWLCQAHHKQAHSLIKEAA